MEKEYSDSTIAYDYPFPSPFLKLVMVNIVSMGSSNGSYERIIRDESLRRACCCSTTELTSAINWLIENGFLIKINYGLQFGEASSGYRTTAPTSNNKAKIVSNEIKPRLESPPSALALETTMYNRNLVCLGGVSCAIYLSTIVYRYKDWVNSDGYLDFNSELIQKITGLKPYEQADARSVLFSLGILSAREINDTLVLHFDWEAFDKILQERLQ